MTIRAVALLLAVLAWTLPQLVWAESRVDPPVTVVLADSAAIGASVEGLNISRSVVGLVSVLNTDQRFAFATVDHPEEVLGPVATTDSDFSAVRERVNARLSGSPGAAGGDLFTALAEMYNFLAASGASTGSGVYLLTGGSREPTYDTSIGRLSPLLGRFQKQGWPVHTLALAGTPRPMTDFLGDVASLAGGETFALTVYDGLKALSEHILSGSAKGAMSKLSDGVLTPDQVLTANVDVAPGTGETTLLFLKQDPYGSLRLSNPSGLESVAGDRAASYVVETPHVVLWRLTDPAPGRWRVEARGISGPITSLLHSSNKYTLLLSSPTPFPVGESTVLVASVQEGEKHVVLNDVRMYAALTAPEAATLVYQMKDDGLSGDTQAGDGYFSVALPPLKTVGDYGLKLELAWAKFDHRVTSQMGFKAQRFPGIKVEPVEVEGGVLALGRRTKVATLYVNVQGEPYPVTPEMVTAGLSSSEGQESRIELVPRYVVGQERTWLYDVYFTPQEEQLHRLAFWMRLDYAGRPYVHASESLVVSSVPPEAPAPPPPPPPAEVRPVFQPAPLAERERNGLLTKAVLAGAAALAAVGLWVLYAMTRTRPYGYLFNDRHELVADFGKLRRNPVSRLMFGNRVGDRAIRAKGLEGVSFWFIGNKVEVRTRGGAPSVRINNQPLIGRAAIQDRAWIGGHGRLYNFVASPPPQAQPESAAD